MFREINASYWDNHTKRHDEAGGIYSYHHELSRSQWPRGLRRRSAAARLLRLRVRIPAGALMSVCRECCVYCQVEVCATG